MKRRHISAKERLAIFTAAEGRCHVCGGRITVGEAWDVEHVIPLALGGDDAAENMRPAHRKHCHSGKTVQDAADIARAKRREQRHQGARPKSRNPIRGWRRFDGTPVKNEDAR